MVYAQEDFHSPDHDGGVHYGSAGIVLRREHPVISDRDLALPDAGRLRLPLRLRMTAPRRVLVTGGSGFIGRSLVPHAGRVRHAIVTGDPRRLADGAVGRRRPDRRGRPDVVIHLATRFVAGHDVGDIPDLVRTNVEFGTARRGGCHAGGRAAGEPRLGVAALRAATTTTRSRCTQPRSRPSSVIVDYYVGRSRARARRGRPLRHLRPGRRAAQARPVAAARRPDRAAARHERRRAAHRPHVRRRHRPRHRRGRTCGGRARRRASSGPGSRSRSVSSSPRWRQAIGRPRPGRDGVSGPLATAEMREDWVFGSSPEGWTAEVPLADGLRRTWECAGGGGRHRMTPTRTCPSPRSSSRSTTGCRSSSMRSRQRLAQTYPNLEVIVIENHSTDGTAEWLARAGRSPAARRRARDETQPAGDNWTRRSGEHRRGT